MKKSEIIQQLQDWSVDMFHDIDKAEEWGISKSDQIQQKLQWNKIQQAIDLLTTLGPNDNITE